MQLLEMRAIVSGRVQGVGFRATVRHIARQEGLTGTVENLPDGTVEIYAQGTKEQLEQLLLGIKKAFGPRRIDAQYSDVLIKKLSFDVL